MIEAAKILSNALILTKTGEERSQQSLVIINERIVWSGQDRDLPAEYNCPGSEVENCQGNLLTPGLIDCHTHLVYAGDRADEFKQRLNGASYSEIAQAGGGILSTVRKTRAASEDELVSQSLPRLLALAGEGVTTVEIKSGYGLDLENEIKMLKAARRLSALSGVDIRTTFLGAHAIPPEFRHNAQLYVDHLCQDMLPAIAELKLADAVDVFCESIAFSLQQTEQLFITAEQLGLPIKCHAEQLSNLGASKLAASMGALSCEHLEFLDREGAQAMADNGTVAVLLPGAFYFLREKQKPPIALLRELKIGMAIATDCNPGSCPSTSLLLMMNMGCQLFDLRVPEVLAGTTFQAAKALGLEKEKGALEVGMYADIVQWHVKESSALCYYFGHPLAHKTMIKGQWQSVHQTNNQE